MGIEKISALTVVDMRAYGRVSRYENDSQNSVALRKIKSVDPNNISNDAANGRNMSPLQRTEYYKDNRRTTTTLSMKKYLSFISIIIFMGCSNIKSIHRDGTLDENNQSVKYILNKLGAKEIDKSIVYFTNGFEGDTIELVNGQDIIFKLPIKTIP